MLPSVRCQTVHNAGREASGSRLYRCTAAICRPFAVFVARVCRSSRPCSVAAAQQHSGLVSFHVGLWCPDRQLCHTHLRRGAPVAGLGGAGGAGGPGGLPRKHLQTQPSHGTHPGRSPQQSQQQLQLQLPALARQPTVAAVWRLPTSLLHWLCCGKVAVIKRWDHVMQCSGCDS